MNSMVEKIITIIFLTLPGCGVYECIDQNFERQPKPIDQSFLVELDFQNIKPITKEIHCEQYYDAMCTERGNFWSVREVGRKSYFQTSAFYLNDSDLGQIKVPAPMCADMATGKETPLKYVILTINGESYWLTHSDGNVRTYSTSKIPNTPVKTKKFKLSIKVNNVPLK